MVVRPTEIPAVIDIGSSKTVCLIAALDPAARRRSDDPTAGLRIVGFGEAETQGMRRGTPVDMQAVERTVRRVLDAAESMADVVVERVIISACAGDPQSFLTSTARDIGRPVTDRDVEWLARAAVREFDRRGRYIMHAIPACFTVDGMAGVTNLRDMRADHLSMDMLFVTADLSPLKNLSMCVEKCHVDLGVRVLTPYASALAALQPDEKQAGALCIDLGADMTTSAVFTGGRPVYLDAVKMGGADITRDISGIFMTPFAAAEAVKKKSGAAIKWSIDERESVDLPVPGDDDDYPVVTKIPRARLNEVIRPRAEEILETVRERLRESGVAGAAGGRIVLTGGGAQLPGMADVTAAIFGRRPRIAAPLHIPDMPETKRGPAYAAAVGLLLYAAAPPEEVLAQALAHSEHPGIEAGIGVLTRLYRQVREWV